MAALIYVKPHGAEGQGTPFTPSEWTFGLNEVSAANSGRTDDAIMHKNRVAQKRKIELGFKGKNKQETGAILRAFNPEYIDVYYEDDMDVAWQWRTFYTGDKSAVRAVWTVGSQVHEKITFNIIEV